MTKLNVFSSSILVGIQFFTFSINSFAAAPKAKKDSAKKQIEALTEQNASLIEKNRLLSEQKESSEKEAILLKEQLSVINQLSSANSEKSLVLRQVILEESTSCSLNKIERLLLEPKTLTSIEEKLLAKTNHNRAMFEFSVNQNALDKIAKSVQDKKLFALPNHNFLTSKPESLTWKINKNCNLSTETGFNTLQHITQFSNPLRAENYSLKVISQLKSSHSFNELRKNLSSGMNTIYSLDFSLDAIGGDHRKVQLQCIDPSGSQIKSLAGMKRAFGDLIDLVHRNDVTKIQESCVQETLFKHANELDHLLNGKVEDSVLNQDSPTSIEDQKSLTEETSKTQL